MCGLAMQVLKDGVLNQEYEVTYSSLLCASRLVNFFYFFIFIFYFLFKKK